MLAPRGEDVVYKVTFGGSQNDVKKGVEKSVQKRTPKKKRKIGNGGGPLN